jgi:hypothetical protein
LYSDRSPDEAVVALAEYLGEPVTHARLFSMNMYGTLYSCSWQFFVCG